MMSRALIITAAVLGVIIVGLLFRFGTLSPCGMLKQELRAEAMQSALTRQPIEKGSLVGITLDMVLVSSTIDRLVDYLTPMQCTQRLIRLKVDRENIFVDDKARYGAALAQMRILEDALKRYKADNGVFPTTEQGLEALVRKPSMGIIPRNWPEGGYLDKQETPKDPWGNAYIYLSPGQHSPDYDLKSLGADGLDGGESYNTDIESWRIAR